MDILAPRRALSGLAVVAAAALATACVVNARRPPAPSPSPAPPPATAPAARVTIALPDHVRVKVGGRIESVPLDEYVLASALSEVVPVGESDAAVATIYEVQAIVARTYAVAEAGRHRSEGFDFCDTTHCQLYEPARIRTSRFAAAARAAVARTSGRVLTYGSRIAEAVFHSDCGGQTASADAVWGGRPVPYLRTIADALGPETHRTWDVSASIDQLRSALNADPRTEVGARLDAIEVIERDPSGRAASIGLRGELSAIVRGDVLRAVVTPAFAERGGLLSTRFAVTRSGARYVFTGTGYGHGVGLCQRGAISRAHRGDATTDILAIYFPGTRITTP
jgi:stage II sporulation protein D